MPVLPSIQQLRQKRPEFDEYGYSDEEIVRWAHDNFTAKRGVSLETTAREMGLPLPESNFGKAFAQGVEGWRSGYADLLPALAGSDQTDDIRRSQARQQLLAETNTAPQSFRDVNSVGDALGYVGNLGAQTLPYVGEMAAGAVTGGLATAAMAGGRAAAGAAARSAARGAMRDAAAQGASQEARRAAGRAAADAVADAAQQRVRRGAAVGAYVPAAASGTGQVAGAQYDQAGEVDAASAIPLGLAYGGLSMLGGEAAVAGALLRRGAQEAAETGVKDLLKRGATQTGLVATKEAATEVAQTGLEEVGRSVVDPSYSFTNPEALDRYAESAVGGFALGGVMGGAASGIDVYRDARARRQAEDQARMREQARVLREAQAQAERERATRAEEARVAAEAQAAEQARRQPYRQVLPTLEGVTEEYFAELGQPNSPLTQTYRQWLADNQVGDTSQARKAFRKAMKQNEPFQQALAERAEAQTQALLGELESGAAQQYDPQVKLTEGNLAQAVVDVSNAAGIPVDPKDLRWARTLVGTAAEALDPKLLQDKDAFKREVASYVVNQFASQVTPPASADPATPNTQGLQTAPTDGATPASTTPAAPATPAAPNTQGLQTAPTDGATPSAAATPGVEDAQGADGLGVATANHKAALAQIDTIFDLLQDNESKLTTPGLPADTRAALLQERTKLLDAMADATENMVVTNQAKLDAERNEGLQTTPAAPAAPLNTGANTSAALNSGVTDTPADTGQAEVAPTAPNVPPNAANTSAPETEVEPETQAAPATPSGTVTLYRASSEKNRYAGQFWSTDRSTAERYAQKATGSEKRQVEEQQITLDAERVLNVSNLDDGAKRSLYQRFTDWMKTNHPSVDVASTYLHDVLVGGATDFIYPKPQDTEFLRDAGYQAVYFADEGGERLNNIFIPSGFTGSESAQRVLSQEDAEALMVEAAGAKALTPANKKWLAEKVVGRPDSDVLALVARAGPRKQFVEAFAQRTTSELTPAQRQQKAVEALVAALRTRDGRERQADVLEYMSFNPSASLQAVADALGMGSKQAVASALERAWTNLSNTAERMGMTPEEVAAAFAQVSRNRERAAGVGAVPTVAADERVAAETDPLLVDEALSGTAEPEAPTEIAETESPTADDGYRDGDMQVSAAGDLVDEDNRFDMNDLSNESQAGMRVVGGPGSSGVSGRSRKQDYAQQRRSFAEQAQAAVADGDMDALAETVFTANTVRQRGQATLKSLGVDEKALSPEQKTQFDQALKRKPFEARAQQAVEFGDVEGLARVVAESGLKPAELGVEVDTAFGADQQVEYETALKQEQALVGRAAGDLNKEAEKRRRRQEEEARKAREAKQELQNKAQVAQAKDEYEFASQLWNAFVERTNTPFETQPEEAKGDFLDKVAKGGPLEVFIKSGATPAQLASKLKKANHPLAEKIQQEIEKSRRVQYRKRVPEGEGSTAEQVTTWLRRPLARLAEGVRTNVRVVANPAEARQLAGGYVDPSAPGFIDGDQVYVIASNITSRDDAVETLAHEVVGHLGIETVLGEAQFDRVVRDVAVVMRNDRSPTLREARQHVEAMYPDADQRTKAREFLAYLAEKRPTEGIVKKVARLVKQALTRLGMMLPEGRIASRLKDWMTTYQNEVAIDRLVANAMRAVEGEQARPRRMDPSTRMFKIEEDEARYDKLWAEADDVASVDDELQKVYALLDDPASVANRETPWSEALNDELAKVAARLERGGEKAEARAKVAAFLTAGDRALDPNAVVLLHENREVADQSFADFSGTMTVLYNAPIGPYEGAVFLVTTDVAPMDMEARWGAEMAGRRVDETSAFAFPVEKFDEFVAATKTADPSSSVYAFVDDWAMSRSLIFPPEASLKPGTDLTNKVELAAWGPDLESEIAQDPRMQEDNGSGKPWLTRETSGVIGDYLRFNAGRQWTNVGGQVMFRANYLVTGKAPGYVADRVTGANPLDKPPLEVSSGRVQRMYRRRSPDQRVRDVASMKRLTWTMTKAAAQKAATAWQTLHSLVQNYQQELPALADYYRDLSEMEAYQVKQALAGHKIATRWRTLPGKTKRALDALAMDATMSRIHPDKEFDDKWHEHLTPDDEQQHAELAARWAALPATAKEIYVEARNKLYADLKLRQKHFTDLVDSTYKDLIANADSDKRREQLKKERNRMLQQYSGHFKRVQGPYFPLLRYGDYVLVKKSADYLAAEQALEQANGAEAKKFRLRLEAMQAQPQHYAVDTFESRLAAERALEDTDTSQWGSVNAQTTADYVSRQDAMSARSFQRLQEALSSGVKGAAGQRIKEALAQMYVQSHPENHALGRTLRRRNVAGANPDMLRNFATSVEKSSFYMSRLKYADALAADLQAMDKQRRGKGFKVGEVYSEISKRHMLDMEYTETPYQDVFAKASGIWHLLSPSYWLVNATQPWLVSLPQMAGRYGFNRTREAMTRAAADAFAVVKTSVARNGFMGDLDASAIADTREREMVETLMERGRIDINITHDLGVMSRGGADLWSVGSRVLMSPAHQTEAVNRLTTSLAAYRLARRRGIAHEKAVDYADEMVVLTQLDYSNVNASRLMKHGALPFGKLVFQFRKYQQGMIQLIAQNARDALKGDKEARKALALMFAMQGATSGVLGLPAIGVVLGAWNMLLDDDDEDGDAETQMRNYLTDTFGSELGRAVAKGPLGYLLDTDLTGRTGLGDIFSPFPYMRDGAQSGRESVQETLFQLSGATGSMMANWIDAWMKLEDGEWVRAIETATPKGVKDLFKAARYAEEGITKKSGEVGVDAEGMDLWDLVLRGAGFSPMVESEYFDASIAGSRTERAISDRRSSLLREYVDARRRRDRDALTQVNRDIRAFNRDHPRFRIDGAARTRSFSARRSAQQDAMRPSGLATRRENLPGIDRFAQ